MPCSGRQARWRKDRIGGTVWYLDCGLAEGYADSGASAGAEGTTSTRRHGQWQADGALRAVSIDAFPSEASQPDSAQNRWKWAKQR